MNVVEQYLNEILGISIRLRPVPEKEQFALPYFLKHLYTLQKGKLFGREIIFLEEKNDEYFTAAQLRKHSEIVEKAFNHPVVFVLPAIESYNRKRLIQKQVAFVIPGKQLFIPQLLIDLREFRQTASKQQEKLLPAAQCLLFYHLLKENLEPFNLKTVGKKLSYTQMTVTRAAKVLERNGIATIKGTKEKYIVFGMDKKNLWERALPLLQTPVKKVYFLEYLPQVNFVYRSSFSALAYYTDLSEDETNYFAVSQNGFNELKKKKKIQIVNSREAEVHLQVWKYNPGVLADEQMVDPLSLYLSLKDREDERVQKALDTLLERLW